MNGAKDQKTVMEPETKEPVRPICVANEPDDEGSRGRGTEVEGWSSECEDEWFQRRDEEEATRRGFQLCPNVEETGEDKGLSGAGRPSAKRQRHQIDRDTFVDVEVAGAANQSEGAATGSRSATEAQEEEITAEPRDVPDRTRGERVRPTPKAPIEEQFR